MKIHIGRTSKNIEKYRENMLFILFYSSIFMTAFLPGYMFGIVTAVAVVCLFLTKKFYCCLPALLFFEPYLRAADGISVFNIFMVLIFIKVLMEFDIISKNIRSNRNSISNNIMQVVILLVYVAYYMFVLISKYGNSHIMGLLEIVFVVLFVKRYLDENNESVVGFFKHYVFVALLSYIYGIIINNMLIEGNEYTEMIAYRYMATFEDPNYMGFFFTIAIFSLIILDMFSIKTRTILIMILYAMVLTTVSISFIVVNILMWIMYFLALQRVSFKTILSIMLSIAVVLVIYQYGINNPDNPIFGGMIQKFSIKINDFTNGDIGGATTGRANYLVKNWDYYKSQNIVKILFGGNAFNTSVVDISGFIRLSHNEYIDLLLNVGLLGTLIMVGYMLWRAISIQIDYRSTNNKVSLFLFMCKAAWICYAFTLTVFLDWRFFLFFIV